MGNPRDRRCKGYPDRDGPVASVQRQEKARYIPESTRAFQKEGGLNTGKKVAKDVLDVSDTPCQISLTTMKAAKRNQRLSRFGKSGQPRNSQRARRWFLYRSLWNVKVGSNVRRAHSNVRRAHMKALVVNAVGHPFDFEDVDIAEPTDREVLLDVQASGLCHTDMLFATNPIFPRPAVFAHEIAGIAAEGGPGVSQFRAGGHFARPLPHSPGSCPSCQSG